MKHKHYDVIIAWANGAEVETYSSALGLWMKSLYPTFLEGIEYRIKQRTFTERAWYPVTLRSGSKAVAQYLNGSLRILSDTCCVMNLDVNSVDFIGEAISGGSWEEVCKR